MKKTLEMSHSKKNCFENEDGKSKKERIIIAVDDVFIPGIGTAPKRGERGDFNLNPQKNFSKNFFFILFVGLLTACPR